MAQFETKDIYPQTHDKALLFLRYIEDIFMIQNGTTEQLILLIDDLNKNHKPIKLDYKISTKQIVSGHSGIQRSTTQNSDNDIP